jgi:hypothetical protein
MIASSAMNRRAFFAALAALPFFGRRPAESFTIAAPRHRFELSYDGERSWATVDDEPPREVPLGTNRVATTDGRHWTFLNEGQGARVTVVPGLWC